MAIKLFCHRRWGLQVYKEGVGGGPGRTWGRTTSQQRGAGPSFSVEEARRREARPSTGPASICKVSEPVALQGLIYDHVSAPPHP